MKLIELHILQNFAPSNLNRDDTGNPGGDPPDRSGGEALRRFLSPLVPGLGGAGGLRGGGRLRFDAGLGAF